MTISSRGAGDRRRLLRVLLYYGILAAALVVVVRFVPAAGDLLGGGTIPALQGGERLLDEAAAVGAPIAATPASGAVLGAISMTGALLIMIPVTWIYMATRRRRGYDESVVHTLLILPVAVAGIVMIVQHSLALAFSLAGIVAAVRFRTTLEDTKDAVYVFLAIGVGVAAGVQAFGLAAVLSILFNGVVLVLWATRFGNVYAGAHAGEIPLGDALLGAGTSPSARVVGDATLLDAAAPADLATVLDRAAGMERHLAEERLYKKAKRANALLIVRGRSAASAQAVVEPALEELASRWKLVEILPAGDGGVTLEYLARLEGQGGQGELLDRMGRSPEVIEAAELRSIAGMGKRS